eukprot:CAMPEP_0119058206 /NCGR_PEP_ID=MMETSP1178-20130426/2573_1 /TAXON_ID=33656 /ORGANISM="unid sp, Strain CCMP2000" /LENGTH=136 /DNA_ID=CAMNT_0007039115 /DNA_START=67 /DNA_END=477 /DNA_ORIENTATION=+
MTMGAASGEQILSVRMTNLEGAIEMSRDGPFLTGSSSESNLHLLDEAEDFELGAAYQAYDRMTATIEGMFSASDAVLAHRNKRPASAPSTLPERWACRFVSAAEASAIAAAEAEAPGFDAVPEYSSGMFLNGIEAC